MEKIKSFIQKFSLHFLRGFAIFAVFAIMFASCDNDSDDNNNSNYNPTNCGLEFSTLSCVTPLNSKFATKTGAGTYTIPKDVTPTYRYNNGLEFAYWSDTITLQSGDTQKTYKPGDTITIKDGEHVTLYGVWKFIYTYDFSDSDYDNTSSTTGDSTETTTKTCTVTYYTNENNNFLKVGNKYTGVSKLNEATISQSGNLVVTGVNENNSETVYVEIPIEGSWALNWLLEKDGEKTIGQGSSISLRGKEATCTIYANWIDKNSILNDEQFYCEVTNGSDKYKHVIHFTVSGSDSSAEQKEFEITTTKNPSSDLTTGTTWESATGTFTGDDSDSKNVKLNFKTINKYAFGISDTETDNAEDVSSESAYQNIAVTYIDSENDSDPDLYFTVDGKKFTFYYDE